MRQVYKEPFSEQKNTGLSERYLRLNYNDPYKSLKEYAVLRLQKYANKHYRVVEEFCLKMEEKSAEEIFTELLSKSMIYKMKIVAANTEQIIRMVMNTIYSYLFAVEISDNLVVAKYSRKTLSYWKY